MRFFVISILSLGLFGFVVANPLVVSALESGPAADTLPNGDVLHQQVIERYRPMYKKYIGVESKRRTESWVYNSKTNELKESSIVTASVRELYNGDIEQTILSYQKDGVETDPKSLKKWGDGKPMHALFNADGRQHYRLRVVDRRMNSGHDCYVVEVEARKKTKQHFQGSVYIDVDTLSSVAMRGGMADMPFGVDRISFVAELAQQQDLLVLKSSSVEALVDVPILYPDVRFLSKTVGLESHGILRAGQ